MKSIVIKFISNDLFERFETPTNSTQMKSMIEWFSINDQLDDIFVSVINIPSKDMIMCYEHIERFIQKINGELDDMVLISIHVIDQARSFEYATL